MEWGVSGGVYAGEGDGREWGRCEKAGWGGWVGVLLSVCEGKGREGEG